MLRAVLRVHHLRPATRTHHRCLVSSVLLTRTYENESVAELKKLAKERGLSAKGNKSTLITRIQGHEQHNTLHVVSSARDPPVQAGAQVRHASSASPTTSRSKVSGPVPGIPLAAHHSNEMASIAFTNINLPDLSQPDPELPTPIPFYPDFYDSVHHPTPYKTGDNSAEPSIPKVLVVSGSSTHGGPSLQSHDSQDMHEPKGSLSSHSRFSTPGGSILQHVTDDITVWEHGQLIESSRTAVDSLEETTGTKENSYSRDLGEGEVKGVWMVVGLLAGSWVLGQIINRPPKRESFDGHHSQ